MARPRKTQAICSICVGRNKAGTTEVYVITEGLDRHFFNVDKAKKMVADGRPAFELAAETINEMLKVHHYDSNHLEHVNTQVPGILLETLGGLILLDGIHRAARCLREQRKFFVHVLTYEESLACLVLQEIASHDPRSIAEKLRKMLEFYPEADALQAEIECSSEVMKQVRELLTVEENNRLILHPVRQWNKKSVDET